MSKRLTKVEREKHLYKDESGTYYLRIQEDGQDTNLSLKTKKITQAVKARDARMAAKAAARLGIAAEPREVAKAASVTVRKVITTYQEAGYPGKGGVVRADGKHRAAEEGYCKTLLAYFDGDAPAADLVQDDLDQYHSWRIAHVTRGDGHRTTDLELNTLNNAMRWAARKRLLKANPIASRERYRRSKDVQHCQDFAPSDIEEFHEVAGLLMSSRRSETLGWQYLFEGMTGLRTEEILNLRMDARPDEPGGVTKDGGSLCVRRAKKSTRDNRYVEVHAGLELALKAHKAWHRKRYPRSAWYFPGFEKPREGPVDKSALTKALGRLFANSERNERISDPQKKFPALKKKFTSHGARAFYVLVRRSQGATDPQIAYEINHVGGVATLERVYGIVPPHWRNSKAAAISWVPKGSPAWKKIRP
ncbi:MAG: hypothetical protein ABSH34_22285 [Verrucomicrobiota bacterium]|jgi:hypothetical protein